jgi:hypothetical protein
MMMGSALRDGSWFGAAFCWMALGCAGAEQAEESATAANFPAAGAGGGGARRGASGTPESFGAESCPGCARFEVPMNGGDQFAMFELSLPAPADMTNTTITWRLRAARFMGTSGGASPYVRDSEQRDQCFIWASLLDLERWTDVACEFSQRYPGGADDAAFENGFDRTRVAKLGLQIHSGAVSAGTVYDDALVYLDSVRFSDGASPDITFDRGIGDLEFLLSESTAPAGARVAYLNR